MLKVRNLKKRFGSLEVLKSIDLDIKKNEVVVLVGPSGGGKTTLLRIINILEKCNEGSIEINGRILCENGKYADKKLLKEIRKDIGMVFQSFNLFPHKSVMENIIEAPVRVLGKSKEKAKEEAREILNFLGLNDKENSYPCELSGGQKQRVAIARALAMEPKLMCFDEPTSALDPELTEGVANIIKDLSKKGMTMLIITHDMSFAENVASRVISMNNGEIIEKHIYEKNLDNFDV